MTIIYILRLQNNKYYVGKTDNIIKRYQEHLNGQGSAWTRKYPPTSLVKSIENASAFDEDKVTKEYMAKYGINNVRGGSYVSDVLDDSQYESVQKEIWNATNCCTRCGRKGHFVKDCHANTTIDGVSIDEDVWVWSCDTCNREFTSESACITHEKLCGNRSVRKCYRCGREGHYANTCYAKTHVGSYAGDYEDYSESDYDSDE